MTIIDGGCKKIMRYPVEETAAKHERIVKEASRLFRERGFENVSVAKVMKAAGLTHGAFYAHFDSKEKLHKGFARAHAAQQQKEEQRILG
jgi:AcrR family transcriptional regulator